MLALAAPAHIPAFAQDVSPPDSVGAQDGVGARRGDAPAPPDSPPVSNKAEAAGPPTGQAQPDEGPPVGPDKTGEKGIGARSDGPSDAPADAGGPEPADAATADGAKTDAGADDASADAAVGDGADAVAVLVADTNPAHQPLGVAGRLAGWVRGTRDNGKRPFAIIDKLGARIFVFAPDGTLLGAAPVLVGLARGDDSPSGIGDKTLAQISPQERTTPAGRFVARFGPAAGEHKTVLWVDYPDAISMHPVITTNPKEHRLKRIKSASAADHRISFGCINVPATFYDKVVITSFHRAGGIVYILPDTRPLREFFPAFAATIGAYAADDQASEAAAAEDQGSGAVAADAAGSNGEQLPPYPVATDPVAAEVQPAPVSAADPSVADPAADPSAANPPADDPDGAIATQPAQQTAADPPKPHRPAKTRHTHRTTSALPG